jgi:hypothetical protein
MSNGPNEEAQSVEIRSFQPGDRRAIWEKAILAKLDAPAKLQRLIRARQLELDDDASEAELVREYFRDALVFRGFDPERDRVFIPNAHALEWVNRALGESQPRNRASTKLKNLGISELRRDTSKDAHGHGRRGWRWTGSQATSTTPIKFLTEGSQIGMQFGG